MTPPDGPFTVFAPTNDAFAKLPPGTVDSLLQDVPALQKVLLRHVVPSTLYSRALLGNSFSTASQDQVVWGKERRTRGPPLVSLAAVPRPVAAGAASESTEDHLRDSEEQIREGVYGESSEAECGQESRSPAPLAADSPSRRRPGTGAPTEPRAKALGQDGPGARLATCLVEPEGKGVEARPFKCLSQGRPVVARSGVRAGPPRARRATTWRSAEWDLCLAAILKPLKYMA
ncbi:hypothetical protein C7M84_019295 [Penaeus vannamei]|uniref:FAS1 domain-containing protein n=1 Tax=Penaeus vannamei TaxID=6689 RepID=A0A3R7LTZ8_PENVA|nr:hypothetical protein C7M84_019295 [Penaeus vannamei]